MSCLVITLIVVIAQSFAYSTNKPIINSVDYYRIGLSKEEQGDWKGALDVWMEAKENAGNSTEIDPRIGFSFISLVTKEKAKSFYKAACKMYFWALSSKNITRFHRDYLQEIRRLRPLMKPGVFHHLIDQLKHNNPVVLNEIKGFWIENDATPSTAENERLLEHWERIAYAREHFNKNHSTVYGTDERADVYIKYGQPSIIRKGTIALDRFKIETWTRELLNKDGFSNSFIMAPTDEGSMGNARGSFARPPVSGDAKIRFLVNQVLQLNHYNYYEIWIYKQLKDNQKDNVIFIFGSPADGGGFQFAWFN